VYQLPETNAIKAAEACAANGGSKATFSGGHGFVVSLDQTLSLLKDERHRLNVV